MPPSKVLVSGAFQSDLRDPKCWHNSYKILRIGFMKKNFKIFSKFFKFFFSFLDIQNKQKDFFAPFPKRLFRGLFYKVSLKHNPPPTPPPISTLTSWSPYKVGVSYICCILIGRLKNDSRPTQE